MRKVKVYEPVILLYQTSTITDRPSRIMTDKSNPVIFSSVKEEILTLLNK